MADFVVRKALAAEAGQIIDLIHLVEINPTGLDWKRFVVAVEPDGKVIGCGQLKPHGGEILEVASIAVTPAHRGRGIARAVIEALLADSPRPLYLMCMSHNGLMYEKFGFRVVPDENLPRYFKRIRKLFTLATVLHRTEELLVMILE